MREWAAANGVLIVHCLVDMKQSILPSFKSAARFKVMAEMLSALPNLADEHPDIVYNADPGEYLMTRPAGYISALKSTGLQGFLRARMIRSIVLCGISTSGCVLSTARAAGDEAYNVTVIEDACVDPVPGLHDVLIQKVLPSQAHIATTEEFQEQWSKANGGEPGI